MMIDFSMDVVAKEHETRLKVAGRARQCSTVSIWVSKYKYKYFLQITTHKLVFHFQLELLSH